MATSTIKPIHIELPVMDDGYYRFSELPRLIAESMFPDNEEADSDPQGDYYVRRAYEQMKYEDILRETAELDASQPGYLHIADNSVSKHPLEWRMGAVLDSGQVHIDWLNEWGESRRPRHVFSTESATEPQAAAPAPVVSDSASHAPVVANSASTAPLPLATGDVAFCFDGIRWNEQEWRKPLGDKPKWLQSCVVTPAQRGVSETRWNPVLIAAWLVANGHAKQNSIRGRFQTKPQLSPWLEAWKTYEADNFDTQLKRCQNPGGKPRI